ncbi:MAG: hypothetical protein ACKO43_04585, partial [Alphaproteobacteria bacterium]
SSDPAVLTATAIEATRLGITQTTFASIKDTAVAWANDPQDEKSNIRSFTASILKDLEITPTSLGKTKIKENLITLHTSAKEILESTFSESGNIEAGAWTLIKQREAAAVNA